MSVHQATSIGHATAEQVVALRERWHTKDHPFYVDFFEGKFGLGPLGALMAQHYQHVKRVLPSLGVAYFKAPHDSRLFILENLAEEEGLMAGPGEDRHAVDHTDTILRFCRAAGLSDDAVKATEQLPAWRARSYFYLNTVREEPFAVIVAMMSTQEGQQPAINGERVLPGLAKHHGYKPGDPTFEFFAEHYLADADHSSREVDLVARLVDTEDLQRRALEVAETALKTRWACMNDIYRTAVLGQSDPLPRGIAVSV
ncbi:MAG TPA: iron-containing redox enzyme family protein [Candidatus Binatia bacterium]|nr:iron-containing redox enzyme family protein [Candidatus Binatia bacterium]